MNEHHKKWWDMLSHVVQGSMPARELHSAMHDAHQRARDNAPEWRALMEVVSEIEDRAAGAIDIVYQRDYEILEIAGIAYAYELFMVMGGLAPIGSLVRVVKRQDKVVTMKIEREGDDLEKAAYQRGFNDHAAAMKDAHDEDDRECPECGAWMPEAEYADHMTVHYGKAP